MENELDQWLDAFVRGEITDADLVEALRSACAAAPDLTWDTLASVDQYHRRGRISAGLSRTIRVTIGRAAVARHVSGMSASLRRPLASVATPLPVRAPVAPAVAPAPAVVPAPDTFEALAAVDALRGELRASRLTAQRYRARLAKLVAYGYRQRESLAAAQAELEATRIHVMVPEMSLTGPVPDRNRGAKLPPPPSSRISWWPFAVLLGLLLIVTASPALREALAPRRPPLAELPESDVVGPGAAPSLATDATGTTTDTAATPAASGDLPPAEAATSSETALPVIPAEPAMTAAAPAPSASTQTQRLSLVSTRYVVRPGVRQALVRVERSGGSAGKVGFVWWTSPSGARSGTDYRGHRPGIEVIPDGADGITLVIPIIANPHRVHTEMFQVGIGHPRGGARLGAIRSSVVIILPH